MVMRAIRRASYPAKTPLLDLRSSVFVPKPTTSSTFDSSMSNDVPENDPAISSSFFLPSDLSSLGLSDK